MMPRVVALVALATLLTAAPARAQEGPVAACSDAPSDPGYCEVVALGAEILLPAMVLAAEGGSPVPGTASTLGMRLTSMPRWTSAGRITIARAEGPDLDRRGGDDVEVTPVAIAADASLGVLAGWSPLPTVGGVGSLDVLVSGSVAPLLAPGNFGGSGGWSWAAGARIGLLRESFTLPGISISGMYRQVRDIRLGDDELEQSDSYIRGDLSVLSARATASKAILLFTLTGGVGWDRMTGDVEFGYTSPGPVRLTAEDARMERLTYFGEVSYTLMFVHFVVGGGVQSAPDLDDFPAVSGPDVDGAIFASAALRLSI